MQKVHTRERVFQTIANGLDHGARVSSPSKAVWDLAPKCQKSVYREMVGRTRPKGMKLWQTVAMGASDRHTLELETKCRKCPPCLKQRAAYWRFRAESELAQTTGRTWFGTLTLSPESHFKMLLRAVTRLRQRGMDFDRMNNDEQFAERHREISREITLYLKRIRKESGQPVRFFLTAEAHKSGLPHYHLLVHEAENRPVRAKTLREQWRLGFTKFNLVAEGSERQSARYVAKYLAKSAIARVRASQGYGQTIADNKTASSHSFSIGKRPTSPDPLLNTTNRVSIEKGTDHAISS